MNDMATMPIRELIEALRDQVKESDDMLKVMVFGVLAKRLEEQADIIDGLINPGWDQFIESLDVWLQHYPADIFTGVSGDPGALFIVALRTAYEDLLEAQGRCTDPVVSAGSREPVSD